MNVDINYYSKMFSLTSAMNISNSEIRSTAVFLDNMEKLWQYLLDMLEHWGEPKELN